MVLLPERSVAKGMHPFVIRSFFAKDETYIIKTLVLIILANEATLIGTLQQNVLHLI